MVLARADVRDVWFVHWPVEPDALAAALPPALSPVTRDGSAWVSVLAQRTLAGVDRVRARFEFPQVALRTYVAPDGRDDDRGGVFFCSIVAGSRLATLGGRVGFGVPYRHASIEFEREGSVTRVRASRAGTELFAATFEPSTDPRRVESESLTGWLTDRYRYYRPNGRSGEIGHGPWRLGSATGTVDASGLFADAGLAAPGTEPRLQYSPGVDIWLERRA